MRPLVYDMTEERAIEKVDSLHNTLLSLTALSMDGVDQSNDSAASVCFLPSEFLALKQRVGFSDIHPALYVVSP